MERAREGVLGRDVRIAQPWQPCEQQVELQLGALGRSVRGEAGREDPGREVGEDRGRDSGEHVAGAVRAPVGGANRGGAAVGVDREHGGIGSELRARGASRSAAISPVSAPIPPTGTSQRPVPRPITW